MVSAQRILPAVRREFVEDICGLDNGPGGPPCIRLFQHLLIDMQVLLVVAVSFQIAVRYSPRSFPVPLQLLKALLLLLLGDA